MVFDAHLDSFSFLLFFGGALVLSVVGVYQIFYKCKKG